MRKIRILSIDGGGLRGVVPMTILKEVQRRRNNDLEIWESFDLIVGTSTGGLITCALTLGDKSKENKAQYSLDQILDIYLNRGKDIFPTYNKFEQLYHNVDDLIHPTFSEKGITTVFKEILGKRKVSECLTKIMVTTYDLNNNKPLFFKTIDKTDKNDLDPLLYDICRATSAGPTYLPTYRFKYAKNPEDESSHRNCIDGGVFINNPSMAGLSEMLKNYICYDIDEKPELDDIYVLSIGTGTFSNKIKDEDSAEKGKLYWANRISDIMMRGVNKTTDYEMTQVMPDDNYLRLTINIDSEEHSNMADSRQETTQYLIKATHTQVLNDNDLMDKLDAFIINSGLSTEDEAQIA
jgi:patatin-like phospholipase/acyl hydrolase